MALAAVEAKADDQLLALEVNVLHGHLLDAQQAPPQTRHPHAGSLHGTEPLSTVWNRIRGRRALNSAAGQADSRKVQETPKWDRRRRPDIGPDLPYRS